MEQLARPLLLITPRLWTRGPRQLTGTPGSRTRWTVLWPMPSASACARHSDAVSGAGESGARPLGSCGSASDAAAAVWRSASGSPAW